MEFKIHTAAAVLIAASSLAGCASVIDGTSQEIQVVTNPAGATCVFSREGVQIGTVVNTPAVLNVKRRKYDITIKCDKPGYAEAEYLNHSGTSAMIAGNIAADIILTAGISSIVDSASGADNRYDPVVNITLAPLSGAPAQAAKPVVLAPPTN